MDVAAPGVQLHIQHWPSMKHVVADFLSRVDNGDNARRDDDNFPHADILRITTRASQAKTNFLDCWLVKMKYFLTTGLPPPKLRTDEKKRLVVRSRNFCLVKGVFHHKGNDGIW